MAGNLIKLAKKSKFLDVNVVIQGEVVRFRVANELRVDYDNVDNELGNQPLIYSYLSTILAKVIKDHRKKTIEKERIFGKLFIEAKDEFYKNNMSRASDEYASNKAKMSVKFRKAALEEAQAEELVNKFKGLVEAFRQRANSLQQISANNRKSLN